MIKRGMLLMLFVCLIGLSGIANAIAPLTTIGIATYGTSTYNLIYEGGLGQKGLIWLDYTNAGDTWSNQMSWADGLNNELTYTLRTGITVSWLGGWRLPSVNEMEHLYYHSLGNSDDLNQPIN